MRSDSSTMAAAWCSSSSRAEPTLVDAALVGALLLAWGLAGVAVQAPAMRPGYLLSAAATAAFAGALYRRDRLRAWHVLALGVGLRALVVALPPVLSDDVFRYLWDGLVQARGLNPYAFRPSEIASVVRAHALLQMLNSAEYYTVYPPVSQLVFWGAGAVEVRWGTSAAYALLKGLCAGADLGVLGLLLRAVPARRALLWAAAPYVVMEATGQVHTEVWCALALVVACTAARRHPWLSGMLLAVAAWIKLVPGLVAPAGGLARRWRFVGGFGGTLVLLAWPYTAPYVVPHVRSSLDLYVRLFEFNAGPYYLLKGLGRLLTGLDVSKQLGPALRLGFLAALPFVWRLAARRNWPLARTALLVYSLFLVTATTVHPWYLLPLLALLPLTGRVGWGWQALALASMGTYWFYTGGPVWPFVWIGWGAWAALEGCKHRRLLLDAILRARARGKYARLRVMLGRLPGHRVLDLGAGEGFVGAVLHAAGASVTLADVAPAARAVLPALTVSGALPMAANTFDTVLLVFVLHHAADAEAVVLEALRVGRRVVILESVYETNLERRVLSGLDRFANGLRGSWMREATPLTFRTVRAWETVLAGLGCVEVCEPFGRPPHRQALFVLGPLL